MNEHTQNALNKIIQLRSFISSSKASSPSELYPQLMSVPCPTEIEQNILNRVLHYTREEITYHKDEGDESQGFKANLNSALGELREEISHSQDHILEKYSELQLSGNILVYGLGQQDVSELLRKKLKTIFSTDTHSNTTKITQAMVYSIMPVISKVVIASYLVYSNSDAKMTAGAKAIIDIAKLYNVPVIASVSLHQISQGYAHINNVELHDSNLTLNFRDFKRNVNVWAPKFDIIDGNSISVFITNVGIVDGNRIRGLIEEYYQ